MSFKGFIKNALMVWGAFSLAGIVIFFAVTFYQIGTSDNRRISDDDPAYRFVTEWFGSGNTEMIDSHSPTGSWAGDSEKAFSVRFSGMDETRIAQIAGVMRGDRLTPALDSAVEFVSDFLDYGQTPWFPTYEDAISDKYYVYPMRLELLGVYPDSAQLLLIRPIDNMAFYGYIKI